MQNLARFRMTSKFGGEYLRNGWRYSKSDQYVFYRDFSRVRRNKSSELWSSNLEDLDVKSYPPKAPFSEDHISALNGCCATNFLHPLENDQVLLAHPQPWTGAPLQLFSKGVQNWLKMQRISRKNFGAKGSSFVRLCHGTCCWMGVITLLGGTGPLKFGRAKNVQNLVRFMTTFEFDCNYLWTG